MRTPEEVAPRRDARWWILHGLAVVGALALVGLLVGGAGFLVASRPGDTVAQPPEATPSAAATDSSSPSPTPSLEPTPTDLGSSDVWLPDVDADLERLVSQGIELRDVKVKGTGARAVDGGVRFEHLDVDAVVPFASVEQQVGTGIRLSPAGDGLVRATLPISVLGRSLDIAADARVTPEGDRIAIEPVRVVDGGWLGDALSQIPAIRQPIPNLPEGVEITTIEVVDDGFRIDATGTNVMIRR